MKLLILKAIAINQYTVKKDWRGLLILRDRTQRLGWEVPYTELLERSVTQLYLSDLRYTNPGQFKSYSSRTSFTPQILQSFIRGKIKPDVQAGTPVKWELF